MTSGSVWDHKRKLREKFGLSTQEDLNFKIPESEATLFYDVWSNVHYGYLGRAAGFTENQPHAGAEADFGGAVGKTDDGDVLTVEAGINMYDKYGEDMTPDEFKAGMSDLIGQLSEYPNLQYQSTSGPTPGRAPHTPYY